MVKLKSCIYAHLHAIRGTIDFFLLAGDLTVLQFVTVVKLIPKDNLGNVLENSLLLVSQARTSDILILLVSFVY